MVALMAGAAVARIVSIIVDGMPTGAVNGLLAIEVVSALLAAIALRRESLSDVRGAAKEG